MANKTINTAGIFSNTFNNKTTVSVNPPYYSTLLPDVVKINTVGVFQFSYDTKNAINFTTLDSSFFCGGVVEIIKSDKFYVTGKFEGIITENYFPVSRLVRLYLSSTGEYIGETTSSAVDGSYKIETPFSGEHFVVAFDDLAGEEYNALIQDKLFPQNLG